ncbi:hypothetical protein Goshw_016958 [Gossypium schwendimanii]|uniref:COBRA C-terminal domain-containing protein n=1 Tax=Gossypium schwendimanii TaxID=34291 RepID=A0A7J9MTJ0_GOSSC|nr:hypothetical protein [Gossypium schwendimanii]
MKMPWMKLICLAFLFLSLRNQICYGAPDDYDDYDEEEEPKEKNPPGQDKCNGIFLTYTFTERNKELPHVKNVTAQAWSFKSKATLVNTGLEELKGWKMFIRFQHREVLVSATNAILVNGAGDFPAKVEKGATLSGYPNTDLKTSVDTAGDLTKMSTEIEFTGTMFGLNEKAIPLPKSIRLANDGWKCPTLTTYRTFLTTCCHKDPKYKSLNQSAKGKYTPRQYGDVNLMYDVLKSYEGSYEAQVTIDNDGTLSRLDNWNLTWEWMRGEFIYSMRGAYTRRIEYSDCIFGLPGQYLKGFDFSQVMNCEKRPVISDLPLEKANDTEIGHIPNCCKNGSLVSPVMAENNARAVFQLRVYKLPPDTPKTVLYPPQRWNITSLVSAHYHCSAPVRVDPSTFPEATGTGAKTYAVASWQVVCNMTKPEKKRAKCCVSFTAYYSNGAVPCSTCACGCDDSQTDKCNPSSRAMLLPPDALLLPAVNRTAKIKAYAKLKKKPVPRAMPCPDNCVVSINWHVSSDHKAGWTARMTLFNWGETQFKDWYAAVELKKAASGYDDVYSFNGTKLVSPKNTIFFQGLKGLEYLIEIKNGSSDSEPKVPGKQQSVISFTKKKPEAINIRKGDGFPSKVFFNGAECALPDSLPSAATLLSSMPLLFFSAIAFLLITYPFHS